MNIIQNHAEDFFRSYFNDTYQEFMSELKTKLYDYRKVSHKSEFVQYLIPKIKQKYDEHLKVCNATDKSKCATNSNYESMLFFMQEELEDLESQLTPTDFTLIEREQNNKEVLEKIYNDIQLLKLGQEMTYDDLVKEFEDLKDYYFLNKSLWKQMFIGKIVEYVASGLISETVCKKIIQTVEEHYSDLISA